MEQDPDPEVAERPLSLCATSPFCFAGVKSLALAMTAYGSVVMQTA